MPWARRMATFFQIVLALHPFRRRVEDGSFPFFILLYCLIIPEGYFTKSAVDFISSKILFYYKNRLLFSKNFCVMQYILENFPVAFSKKKPGAIHKRKIAGSSISRGEKEPGQ